MLVDAREKLHIPWGDQDNQRHGDLLMAFDTRSAKMAIGQLEASVFQQYLPAITALWADSGIQNAYDRRREFQLVGGLKRARLCTMLSFIKPSKSLFLVFRVRLSRELKTTVEIESERVFLLRLDSSSRPSLPVYLPLC